MESLACDIPASFLKELTRRAGTNGSSVSALVSEALAGYLDASLHTLFQVSTSGSLVESGQDHGAATETGGAMRALWSPRGKRRRDCFCDTPALRP